MVAEAITVAAELKIMTVKEIKTLLLELHLVTHQIQQIIPTEIIPILQEQKATLTEITTTHLLDPTLQVHLAMAADGRRPPRKSSARRCHRASECQAGRKVAGE